VPVPAEAFLSPETYPPDAMPTDAKSRQKLLDPDAEIQVLKISRKALKLTNLDKLYWPEDRIAKRDLLEYYHRVAPLMLPYLRNRPMSLHRHPNGYAGESFYQKDVTGKVPDWAETFAYRSEEEPDQEKEFLVCTDEATLLYMANLGCIEINPWSSTVKRPDHPDWCVLDLDPDQTNTFDQVVEVALLARDLLESAGIRPLIKTSGSTGLHLYIPLQGQYTYDQSLDFARLIAALVERAMPALTSTERSPAKRRGKIYLDFLQNRTQATLAAPYSVRPKPKAPVSMPLHWEEVKKGLRITDFTLKNAVKLLEERGDIFKGVFGKGIDMAAALEKLEAAGRR
jgi:bifunctional non-homologous end joining protein LigD